MNPFRDSMEAALARAEQAAQEATQRADELAAEVAALTQRLAEMPENGAAIFQRIKSENIELRKEIEILRAQLWVFRKDGT